jgi:hypothetical protein
MHITHAYNVIICNGWSDKIERQNIPFHVPLQGHIHNQRSLLKRSSKSFTYKDPKKKLERYLMYRANFSFINLMRKLRKLGLLIFYNGQAKN